MDHCSQNIVSNANSKHGWLATPGFPLGYAHNVSCVYNFEGAKDERIQIVFETFALSLLEENAENQKM